MSIDPLLVAAYDAQAACVAAWLAGLADDDLATPSRLPGWRLGDLVAHVVGSARPLTAATPAARGTRAQTVTAYVGGYASAAADAARAADGLTAAAAVDAFAAARADVLTAAARWVADPVLAVPGGAVRASDLLRTRVLELVVHPLDAPADGPALDRQAVRVGVRLLAEVLAGGHPGRSIEVRVPPYAAVQLGDASGPTHTRGTPPNVVECAPEVFLAVAAGRRSWADAVAAGAVRASGARADLSPYLPVVQPPRQVTIGP